MKLIEKDTPGQRIADLCKDYGISQKELAEKIGLSAPQLSRIISGKTSTINSDSLIGIAETFKVSTDYILGLSSVSVRKSYDISQLGLSENAIKGLVTETIDVEILNRLLENPKFPQLLNLIRIYFENSVALGMMSRNDMINMATMSLSEIMQQNPTQKAEAKHDIRLLNAQKFGEHEAEIERMKNIFMSILREIKGDIDTQQKPSPDINAEMFQSILASATENPPVTLDDVLSLVTSKMSMVMEVDDNAKEQFNALFTQMAEQFKE